MGRSREGHIRERNGRFEVSVAGEYIGTFESQERAERMARAAINEDAGDSPCAFSVFASDWMDKRELDAIRRQRLRPFLKERSRWRTHVQSAAFWDMPIKHIAANPRVIQEWIGTLVETKGTQIIKRKDSVERRSTGRLLSRRVIEDSLSLVKLCLDDARVIGKYRGDNPARLVKLPRFEAPVEDGQLIVHLTEDEIEALFSLELPPLQRSVFAVAIYGGLRMAEMWGLRWQDVVLDGPQPALLVRRAYNGPLKTPTSRRDVPLLAPAREALKAWRAAQDTVPIGSKLVWPRDDGGCHGESYTAGWRSKDDASRHYPGWREKAGIREEVGFLELRHTCGCHLAQGSWTPRPLSLHEIKCWLGHSSINTTQRHYSTLTSDNLHAAVSFNTHKPGINRKRGLTD